MVPTSERRELIDFSIPIASTHDTLVSRADMPDIKEGDSLKGKTLQVTKGTVFEQRAQELAQKYPGLKVEAVKTNYVELALQVSMGNIDLTIIDEMIFDLLSQFRDNLKKNIVFEREDQLAAGIRKNSPQLKKFIDDAIRDIKLTTPDQRFIGDLDQIRERGVLRAVTRNHPGTYFMWKGRIMGYEYELLQRFARDLDVRLEIIVAPKHSDLLNFLRDGKADVTASLLTATDIRDSQGVDFGPAYMEEKVSVVGRPGETINSIKDLEGRTVHVLESSSQYEILREILEQYPDINVDLVPEELTIPQILDRVAEGEYDLTIADDITVRLEHQWRDDVDNLLDLHEEDNVYAWAVREGNPQLLEAVHNFFNDKKITQLRKTLFRKYFDEPKRTRDEIKALSEKGEISPFDKIVKRYADKHDFDWRLVVAQMYQESTFDPKKPSHGSARAA
ncbi:transporter substrate-binding domain-containing protein [Microbulbifer sediminum]|uniref:transporter substrate-binding domain-containing protein n=1 Tax=Microbulbifer sediminum TaxID=2904250 RepID=UPI001F48198E|nr:transporter substrate-binding domain-containing protein [Microbulbifer sediminum]